MPGVTGGIEVPGVTVILGVGSRCLELQLFLGWDQGAWSYSYSGGGIEVPGVTVILGVAIKHQRKKRTQQLSVANQAQAASL